MAVVSWIDGYHELAPRQCCLFEMDEPHEAINAEHQTVHQVASSARRSDQRTQGQELRGVHLAERSSMRAAR